MRKFIKCHCDLYDRVIEVRAEGKVVTDRGGNSYRTGSPEILYGSKSG